MYKSSFDRRSSLDTIGHNIFDFPKYTTNLSGPYYLMTKPFRVVDVYDVAAEIGKDFERIIDQFGTEAVSGLMPKVIGVLEELEEYAQRYEAESKDILNLQATVQKLELESLSRAQERSRYEKDLEQIEETWHAETKDLMNMIEKLQDDNKRLHEELEKIFENSQEDETQKMKELLQAGHQSAISNEDIQLMIRLKEVVDRQTHEIRELKKELAQKCLDLDAMQQQSDRLAKLNAELRRKHCVSKKQSEQLLEEKSNLQVELCEKEQIIKKMRQCVVHSDSMNKTDSVDLGMEEDSNSTKHARTPHNQELAESMARLSEAQLIDQINAEGKMMAVSSKNSTQTRFTLSELKGVLMERNELKSKLIEVEEELAVYKMAGDEDPPVQGPVNKEPDDKISPKSNKESGVQKLRFFSRLTSLRRARRSSTIG